MASGTSTGKNINLKKYGGTATSLGQKAAASSIPVELSTEQEAKIDLLATKAKQDLLLTELQLKADLTETQPVSAASLPLPSGAATSALQTTSNTSLSSIDTKTPTLGQALAAASVPVILPAATITTLTPPAAITGFALEATLTSIKDTAGIKKITDPLPAGTNNIGDVDVLTINGVAPAFGTGARGATVQRVTVATDDVVLTSQSGTWTVQPGNTANTTPWLVTDTPATTGGLSKFHLVGAATTNPTNIKAGAGQVYSITAFNLNASPRYLKFHNTAGTPTAGTAVTDSFLIPGNTSGAGMVINFDKGITFSTGIGITTVTEMADSGTTAIAANEMLINIYYK